MAVAVPHVIIGYEKSRYNPYICYFVSIWS